MKWFKARYALDACNFVHRYFFIINLTGLRSFAKFGNLVCSKLSKNCDFAKWNEFIWKKFSFWFRRIAKPMYTKKLCFTMPIIQCTHKQNQNDFIKICCPKNVKCYQHRIVKELLLELSFALEILVIKKFICQFLKQNHVLIQII